MGTNLPSGADCVLDRRDTITARQGSSEFGTGTSRRSSFAFGKPVRAWLVVLAGLVFCLVLVGGATRMTGSGLSITEWRPLVGAIPPLDAQSWAIEFDKYRQTSQYAILNKGMTLSAFKEIYWWEWSHRQLARFIGIIFIAGFAVFLTSGRLRGRGALAVGAIGVLGGTQAAVGWIMVHSGLQEGMTAVAPLKLALHLLIAGLILTALVSLACQPERTMSPAGGAPPCVINAAQSWWVALLRGLGFWGDLSGSTQAAETRAKLQRLAGWLVVAVLGQIALGALVAGSRAGLIYNTWPLMDGRLVPRWEDLFVVRPWIENIVDNPLTVQFNHRMVAYGVLGLSLWQAVIAKARAPGSAAARRSWALAALILIQAGIGVATLLFAVPMALALLHQGVAMIIIITATIHWRLLAR